MNAEPAPRTTGAAARWPRIRRTFDDGVRWAFVSADGRMDARMMEPLVGFAESLCAHPEHDYRLGICPARRSARSESSDHDLSVFLDCRHANDILGRVRSRLPGGPLIEPPAQEIELDVARLRLLRRAAEEYRGSYIPIEPEFREIELSWLSMIESFLSAHGV